MQSITLYQFELCPFCNKARAGLDLRGLGYSPIEVNPMNKRELAHVEPDENGRKKVPIIQVGDVIVRDSAAILRWAEDRGGNGVRLLRATQAQQDQIDTIETWVDD